MHKSIHFCQGLLVAAVLFGADAAYAGATGEEVFNKNCAACHSAAEGQHRFGPSLHAVVGRAAGSAAGYSYSAAMKNAGITWSEDKLAAFLASPQAVVAGTKMPFGGLKDAADVAALIAYLKTK